MKSSILLLALAGTLGAAQATKPAEKQATPTLGVKPGTNGDASGNVVAACAREGDKDCIFVIGTTTDAHGCQQWTGFVWDEGSQTCAINVQVQTDAPPATCSPLGKPDTNGIQHMVCWYKPVPPAGGTR